MPRGGRRQGQPGRGYSNRTDLNVNRAAPSQQYGQRAAQERAMQAVPMATPQPPRPTPDDVPNLTDPTRRPDEPLTTGLGSGPGPGPEILPVLGAPPGPAVDESLVQMARYLPALELMASQPTASVQMRNFVRRLRSAIPPGALGGPA